MVLYTINRYGTIEPDFIGYRNHGYENVISLNALRIDLSMRYNYDRQDFLSP